MKLSGTGTARDMEMGILSTGISTETMNIVLIVGYFEYALRGKFIWRGICAQRFAGLVEFQSGLSLLDLFRFCVLRVICLKNLGSWFN